MFNDKDSSGGMSDVNRNGMLDPDEAWVVYKFFSELEKEEKQEYDDTDIDFDEDFDIDEFDEEWRNIDFPDGDKKIYSATPVNYHSENKHNNDSKGAGIEINPKIVGDYSNKSRVYTVLVIMVIGVIIGTVIVSKACFEVSAERGDTFIAICAVIFIIFIIIGVVLVIKSTMKKSNKK